MAQLSFCRLPCHGRRAWLVVLLALVLGVGAEADARTENPRSFATRPASSVAEPGEEAIPDAAYAPWAHSHWVWLSSKQGNRQALEDLVAGYQARNISVGAVNIDSEWSTGINNFIFDERKYPNASAMIQGFHNQGIKVIVWATSMVNTDSSNYKEGFEKGYYVKSLFGLTGIISWWHGDGSLLDYSNPDAVSWWHRQLDNVLDIGVDGFKCDGTDPYILELIRPLGQEGVESYRAYANAYYSDFFDYANAKRGGEALIMARPVDSFSVIHLNYAPQRVMASGWVGDQDPTFDGLKTVLQNYMYSAWSNYANFGSDTGGYRSGSRTGELLLRWAQVNSFSPLMENGGNGDHQPWLYGENVSEIYRDFVNIHYGLQSYLLTHGSAALENGTSVIQPLAERSSDFEKVVDIFVLDSLCYLLGPDILVAPIYESGGNAEVKIPPNSSWRYWFNSNLVLSTSSPQSNSPSNHRFTMNFPINEFGAFRRIGSILPITTQSPYHLSTNPNPLRDGDRSWIADEITLVWDLDATNNETITIRRWKRPGVRVSVIHCQTRPRCFSLRVSAAELMQLTLKLVYGNESSSALSSDKANDQALNVQGRIKSNSSADEDLPVRCQGGREENRHGYGDSYCEMHLGSNDLGQEVMVYW